MEDRLIRSAELQCKAVPDCKTRPYTPKSKVAPTRYPYPLLRTGALAAHRVGRLMLLGSPPDMVHGSRLRKTRSSTQKLRLIRKSSFLKRGIHPCCSGFQVQGSAMSPAGMASFYSLTLPYYYTRYLRRLQGEFQIFTENFKIPCTAGRAQRSSFSSDSSLRI